MEKEKVYYFAWVDLSLASGQIQGGVSSGDAKARGDLRLKIDHDHGKGEEELALNIWYDSGKSLIIYTDTQEEALEAYEAKLVAVEDRIHKYGSLFRRALTHVQEIKAGSDEEQEMLKRYTPDFCKFAKGAIIDLSADLCEQIHILLGSLMKSKIE